MFTFPFFFFFFFGLSLIPTGSTHDDTTVAVVFFSDTHNTPAEAEADATAMKAAAAKQTRTKRKSTPHPPTPPPPSKLDGLSETVDAPELLLDVREAPEVPDILRYHDLVTGQSTTHLSVGLQDFRAAPAEYDQAW